MNFVFLVVRMCEAKLIMSLLISGDGTSEK
jgi:hypothetical protein